MKCDLCEMLSINGVACHESGCPNLHSRWDEASQLWVRQVMCDICGYQKDEDQECCEFDDPVEEDSDGYRAGDIG
jgi:hypothetical protein